MCLGVVYVDGVLFGDINPFVPNAPFLYLHPYYRKLYVFFMFSGSRERVHWERMG